MKPIPTQAVAITDSDRTNNMRREEANLDQANYVDYDRWESPPYVPPSDSSGGDTFEYFSDPYVSETGQSVVSTGLYLAPGQSYAPGVSRVGPTVSRQPFMNLDSGMRAGAIFGRGAGQRYGGRAPFGRGFNFTAPGRLRGRRKGRHR